LPCGWARCPARPASAWRGRGDTGRGPGGGTAGLVTIEDILEEIVGEIADEYDRERPPVEWLSDGSARVSTRLPVEELADLFAVSIDAEDVETVGLPGHVLGKVPIRLGRDGVRAAADRREPDRAAEPDRRGSRAAHGQQGRRRWRWSARREAAGRAPCDRG
jgi:hypothetical protein